MNYLSYIVIYFSNIECSTTASSKKTFSKCLLPFSGCLANSITIDTHQTLNVVQHVQQYQKPLFLSVFYLFSRLPSWFKDLKTAQWRWPSSWYLWWSLWWPSLMWRLQVGSKGREGHIICYININIQFRHINVWLWYNVIWCAYIIYDPCMHVCMSVYLYVHRCPYNVTNSVSYGPVGWAIDKHRVTVQNLMSVTFNLTAAICPRIQVYTSHKSSPWPNGENMPIG